MSLIELIEFDRLGDDRGQLIALEGNKNIPFEINRVYYMTGLSADHPRGFHAHKKLQQVAICLSGKCRFIMDDGTTRESCLLDSPDKGLLIGSMIWHEMHEFTEDCVLMVVASEHYDESDYIRQYEIFTEMVKNELYTSAC